MAMSSESVSCSTVGQLKVYVSAKFENPSSKTIRQGRLLTIQFPSTDAERTSAEARCSRGRVLRVRIVLYSGSIEGESERDVRNPSAKNYTPSRRLPFQFPNIGAERTSVGARCRHGRVLRVRIVLYSG
jgi:hypothetical protein